MSKKMPVILVILTLVALLVLNGCSAKDLMMKYELKKGDVFKYKIETDMKTSIPALGQEIPVKMSYTMEMKVTDVANDIYTIDYLMKDWKLEGVPAGEVPPMEDVKMTVKMDKQGKVKEIKSDQANMNLGNNDMLNSVSIVFPKDPIVKDKPFTVSFTMPVPGVKDPVKVDSTFTYKGDETKQGIDSYKVLNTMTIPLNMTISEAGESAKMSGSVKSDSTNFIDKKTGMIVEQTGTMNMDMTIEPVGVDPKALQGMPAKIETKLSGTVKMTLVK